MGSGQWEQNELHPFNCNTVPGGQANYYIIGPSEASIGAPVACGIGGGEPPAASGGYFQLEANTVHASVVDQGYTSGYLTNTPNSLYATGDITLRTSKYGHVDPPLTTGIVEASDWSSFNPSGYGFPTDDLLQTHRQSNTKGTNNANAQIVGGIDSPITLTDKLVVRTLSHMPNTARTLYISLVTANNHYFQVVIATDANLYPNAYTRYYNGSTWDSASLKQRQSGALVNDAVMECDATFDPASSSVAVRWALDPVWGNLADYPAYPASWPGWASFGGITSISTGLAGGGAGAHYNYAFRAEFTQTL